MKKRLLFVCMMGRDRSQKACEIVETNFSDKFESKAAGVSTIADVLLTESAIEWADKIICMEKHHKEDLLQQFPEANHKDIDVWHIPGYFSFEDEELEERLMEKIKEI